MKTENLDLIERTALALRDGHGGQSLTCSPDVVVALVARIRELEKRCHIVESHPPDFAIDGEPLETQVFILKERLLDERHKSYQLECEVKELEEELQDEVARWRGKPEDWKP